MASAMQYMPRSCHNFTRESKVKVPCNQRHNEEFVNTQGHLVTRCSKCGDLFNRTLGHPVASVSFTTQRSTNKGFKWCTVTLEQFSHKEIVPRFM